MTDRDLRATATGCTNILEVQVSTAHNAATATAVITCEGYSGAVGDDMEVNLGYVGNIAKVFEGYTKQIERSIPDNIYTVTANDILIRAVDYFVVSSNPDNPFSRSNISAEELIEDVLNEAKITDYTGATSNFVFGVNSPVEVNLVGAYDFCSSIADILAWQVYADVDGQVIFEDRKPYPMGGDTPLSQKVANRNGVFNIINFAKRDSDRDLRNRVVVYGADGIYADASAVSPYLPAYYYKTVVVGSQWIDTQQMADDAASYNLTKLNRLTEEISVACLGYPQFRAREVVTVDEDVTGISNDDWYVFSAEHRWGPTGYTTFMELRI